VHETRQPHMRGGAREPLSARELEDKLAANLRFGGLDDDSAAASRAALDRIAAGGHVDFSGGRA
jgi:hypothetical protein